ncbi:MAG: ABC transporter permease [Clostridiales bacterium]|jgi:ABC-2 type transport system permease protein|nr:ABC transporter permease [Clostridiales bacterium]
MNMIKSEFYKLKKTKVFYICLLACVALAVFSVILAGAIQAGVLVRGVEEASEAAEPLTGVSLLEQTLGLDFLPTIIAIFVSVFVAGEFVNGAMKNYVSKGYNRVGTYLSKFLVCGAAVMTMYIVNITLACTIGSMIWGFDPTGLATAGSIAAMVLSEGLLLLAYTSVFVLLAMWLRSNGASVAVNICVVSLFSTVLMLTAFITGDSITLANYWISGNVSALATIAPESGAVLQGVIVGFCYLIGGTVIGSLLFKKQDIK